VVPGTMLPPNAAARFFASCCDCTRLALGRITTESLALSPLRTSL
jgi:hypothetical protein